MSPKIKSAWTGTELKQQDNRSKSMAGTQAGTQAGAPGTTLPNASSGGQPFAGSQAGNKMNVGPSLAGMGSSIDGMMQARTGNYQPGSPGGMPMAPQQHYASQAPQQASHDSWSGDTYGQAPQQKAPAEQHDVPVSYDGTANVTDHRPGSHSDEWKDTAKIAASVGMAAKPGYYLDAAQQDIQDTFDKTSGNSGKAEQAALDILMRPDSGQQFWEAQAASISSEIDRQTAAAQRQIQQAAAAGGGGMGGVQIGNMAEVVAQGNRAKSEALTELAHKKEIMRMDDKKLVISALMQLAGQEDARRLAMLAAMTDEERATIDYMFTAMGMNHAMAEAGYDPTSHPHGSQTALAGQGNPGPNTPAQVGDFYRDDASQKIWRKNASGGWTFWGHTTDSEGRGWQY